MVIILATKHKIVSVVNGRANLPCFIKSETKLSEMLLILWYKDGDSIPSYT